MVELSERGNILLGIIRDAQAQDILLSQPLIEIIRQRLNISEAELEIVAAEVRKSL